MALHSYTSLLFAFFACLICSSNAYQFYVGGRDGWVERPSENYNQWAGRMRFQVGDTLIFKYNEGSDSVLMVNKDDYDNCNVDKPILKMEDGNSIFKFDRSGPFYFISGNKTHCENGQKIITVVLAIRKAKTTPTPPTEAPPPAREAPVASPPKGSSSSSSPPAMTPGSSSPGAETPGSSIPVPSASPAANPPAMESTPVEAPMASSPSSYAPGTSPVGSPTPSTTDNSPSLSPSPSASLSPTSSATPGSPASSPAGSSGPTSSNTPADINSPPRSSAVSAFTPTAMLVSTVSLVISAAIGGFIISF